MSEEWNANRNCKADFKIGDVFNRASQNSNSVLPSDDGEEKLEKLDSFMILNIRNYELFWTFLYK